MGLQSFPVVFCTSNIVYIYSMAWVAEELYADCVSLDDVLSKTLDELQNQSESGLEIHYVAGTISSDGDEHIERNLAELLRFQHEVALNLGEKALVLTSPAIFTSSIYSQLKIFDMPRSKRELHMQSFWDKIIASGYVSGIHFAPNWVRSIGAKLEHEAAIQRGVNIYYL